MLVYEYSSILLYFDPPSGASSSLQTRSARCRAPMSSTRVASTLGSHAPTTARTAAGSCGLLSPAYNTEGSARTGAESPALTHVVHTLCLLLKCGGPVRPVSTILLYWVNLGCCGWDVAVGMLMLGCCSLDAGRAGSSALSTAPTTEDPCSR